MGDGKGAAGRHVPWEHLAPLGKAGCSPSATSWGGGREKAAPSCVAAVCRQRCAGQLPREARRCPKVGLKSFSWFRVWSEELLQSMVVWEKRASG